MASSMECFQSILQTYFGYTRCQKYVVLCPCSLYLVTIFLNLENLEKNRCLLMDTNLESVNGITSSVLLLLSVKFYFLFLATWLLLPGDWYSFEPWLFVPLVSQATWDTDLFFLIVPHAHKLSLYLPALSIDSEFVHVLESFTFLNEVLCFAHYLGSMLGLISRLSLLQTQ